MFSRRLSTDLILIIHFRQFRLEKISEDELFSKVEKTFYNHFVVNMCTAHNIFFRDFKIKQRKVLNNS